jgi:chemotaxis protein MotB
MSASKANDDDDQGAPAWVTTFADLMSLLMCFFVLLLSFSDMDVQKFKLIAAAMKNAFGVQNEINLDSSPKGTSVIAREFSPGKPVPSALQEMRQSTTDETKNNLDFTDSLTKHPPEQVTEQFLKEASERLEEKAQNLKEVLDNEITKGLLEIETKENEIMIRIREKGSFPSGSAYLQPSFIPVLKKIGEALAGVKGKIIVAGHTDNFPIATSKYPSNWLLSAARSAAVVHYLTQSGLVKPDRIQIRAHAETQPIAPNDSELNRAKNRRVEIIVSNKYWWSSDEIDIPPNLDSEQ